MKTIAGRIEAGWWNERTMRRREESKIFLEWRGPYGPRMAVQYRDDSVLVMSSDDDSVHKAFDHIEDFYWYMLSTGGDI